MVAVRPRLLERPYEHPCRLAVFSGCLSDFGSPVQEAWIIRCAFKVERVSEIRRTDEQHVDPIHSRDISHCGERIGGFDLHSAHGFGVGLLKLPARKAPVPGAVVPGYPTTAGVSAKLGAKACIFRRAQARDKHTIGTKVESMHKPWKVDRLHTDETRDIAARQRLKLAQEYRFIPGAMLQVEDQPVEASDPHDLRAQRRT